VNASAPRLILASASPRRRELLTAAGYVFEVHPTDINEDDHPPLAPGELAEFLAVRKAAEIANRFPDDIVLAADTVVAVADQILGKPADDSAAAQMLQLLSGSTHQVITGICVEHRSRHLRRAQQIASTVVMKKLSPEEIEKYVRSGLWHGKAGGYGIQDEGSDKFVTRTAGSHSNIMGLPMEIAIELLTAAGVQRAPGTGNTPAK
jgi:septum formation protein